MHHPFVTYTDGALKNISLMEAFRNPYGLADSYLSSVQEAYRKVPWLYRSATLRAQALSAVPYVILDQAGQPMIDDQRLQPISGWITTTLYLAELSRTLYGAAYFLVERNPFGYNAYPRHIPTPAVSVEVSKASAEVGSFRLMLSGNNVVVDTKRMMWSWLPNPFAEAKPGIAPALVALQAAGLLSAIDEMSTRYFSSGGVPITAVSVPPTTLREDREKLENWFTRFAAGVRNAFKFLPVNKDTVFQQIGANIKETLMPELTSAQRDNVAVALGVPPTVIDGTSANYATASNELLSFYLHTVVPECMQIQEHFNATLFRRYGLEFRFEPNKLEVLQSAQLEQAKTLSQLVGQQPILTLAEARQWIGLDPVPRDLEPVRINDTRPIEEQPIVDVQQDIEQMKHWRTASLNALRSGSSAAVGTPWDAELSAASTANMVRRVYDAHWPKPVLDPAVAELQRFNDLMTERR